MGVPATFKGLELAEPKTRNKLVDTSLSELGPDEVAIKITATAINPIDWKVRDWNVFVDKYPAVLGTDAAGEIAAVGSKVSNFEVGERVFFQGIINKRESSTFQQYCKMPAALVAKTPSNISDDEAAGILLATLAVITGFYAEEGRHLTPPWKEGGETVGKGRGAVVLGGSSSVGQYAIQMARLSGFDKVITNASPANHEFLKQIGATVVLDRSASSPEDFKAALDGTPIDFVYDSIGAKSTQLLGVQILRAVGAQGGNVVKVHAGVTDDIDPEAKKLGESQDAKIGIKAIIGLGSAPHLRHISEPLIEHIGGPNGYIAQGRFRPNRVRLVPGGLKAVEEALDLNKEGISGQKVVFRPFD